MIYYIYSLALIPFFSLRAVTPIFATALFARFAPGWEWVAQSQGLDLAGSLPPWMLSDISLFILAIGAIFETIASLSCSYRELMVVVQPFIRGLAGFFLCFHLVKGDFSELLSIISKEGLTNSYVWDQSFAYSWSFAIGWLTFFGASLRSSIQFTLMELDPDDDLRLQALLGLLESSLGFTGCFVVMIAPFLALIIGMGTIAGLYAFRAYLAYSEKAKRVPCNGCNQPRHTCASWCNNCRAYHTQVNQVGFMGMVKPMLVRDFAEHRFKMTTAKRCFYCGERFKERNVIQKCTGCGQAPFNRPAEVEEYKSRIQKRFWKTIMYCSLFGLVPVLGLIPGTIFYKVYLTSPLRGYIPTAEGCLGRWFVRLCLVMLMMMQGIPGFGFLALPLMCMINYSVYKILFERQVEKLHRNPAFRAAASHAGY